MSIAVSAVIVPSPLMRGVLAGFGAANVGAALALALGLAGTFHLRFVLAGACLAAGALLAATLRRAPKVRQIDISGLGQIRLTVQQGIGQGAAAAVWRLLPGSTVWPGLLLLRLCCNGDDGSEGAEGSDGSDGSEGATMVLALLPDSVEQALFRRLSVAIRNIVKLH